MRREQARWREMTHMCNEPFQALEPCVCVTRMKVCEVRRQTVQQKNVRATSECVYTKRASLSHLLQLMKSSIFCSVGYDIIVGAYSTLCSGHEEIHVTRCRQEVGAWTFRTPCPRRIQTMPTSSNRTITKP